MVESNQSQNQPEIKEISGIAHVGVGDINIYPSFGKTIKSLRQHGHDGTAEALEKFIVELRELHNYQQTVNELSRVLSMLQDLEFALASIEPTIRGKLDLKRIDFNSLDAIWRSVIWRPMKSLSYFASHEMRFLKPCYKITEYEIIGPLWIVQLTKLQKSFEVSLKEHDMKEMYEQILNMLLACREHLFEVTRQLVMITNQLVMLSNQILARTEL